MVKSKAVYVALGVSRDGVREVLGLWIADNEGAKFWLSVMTELKNRGLQDILIAVVDGLKGFPPSHRNCVSTADSVPRNGVTLFFGHGLAAVTGRRLSPGPWG